MKQILPYLYVVILLAAVAGMVIVSLQPIKLVANNEIPEEEIDGKVVRYSQGDLDIDVSATVSHRISVLGRQGFFPATIEGHPGDEFRWINNDPEKKDVTLVFQRPFEVNKFITSPVIKPGQEWIYTFPRHGQYTYWTVGYGKQGKVIAK